MSKLTLSFKSKVLKIYPVLKGRMTLGSDPACTIHIDSLAVQPKHAEINTANNVSNIRDLNTNEGTFINQTKLEGIHPLKDGEVIRVGKHTIAYSFSEDINSADENEAITADIAEVEAAIQVQAHEKSHGWLQIMNGPNLGKTMSLNKAMTNLGKPGVSTAVVTKRDSGYFVSHLEGNQPTLIKNKELGNKIHQLNDGDTIQIGSIKMQFYLE